MRNKNRHNQPKENKRALIIEHLANKYGMSKEYVRFCVKGKGESENAEKIMNEYKELRSQIEKLLPNTITKTQTA